MLAIYNNKILTIFCCVGDIKWEKRENPDKVLANKNLEKSFYFTLTKKLIM